MRQLKNQSGSILLLVMVAAPVAAILFFSLIDMALISRRQSVINRNVVGYSALLDAAIDYTTYAIRNRWCMTPEWQRDLTACGLTHPRNLERLFLDPQTLQAYFERNGPALILLGNTMGTIDIPTIPNQHPLWKVVKNMETSGGDRAIDQLEIRIQRIDNKDFPRRGRESYLMITASLISATLPFFRGFTSLSARSRVMITPRELNYFSLVVARNLYLDGTGPANGDFSVPVTGGGAGIAFESPVYVNGDIHVPQTGTGSYTAATFSSKVVIGATTTTGGGRLMMAGAPLAPPSPGGKESVYSNMDGFGGFKRGIDMDGARDAGLDVFSGNASPAPLAVNASLQCIQLNIVKSDLGKTKNTDLTIKQVAHIPSGGSNAINDKYSFNLGLTEGNYFVSQDVKPYVVGGYNNVKFSVPNPAGKSMFFFKIKSGTMEREFTLRPGATPGTGLKATMNFKDGAGVVAAKLHISLDHFEFNGHPQPHLKVLHIEAEGQKSLLGTLDVTVRGFDLGSWAGRDRRVREAAGITDFTLAQASNIQGTLRFETATNALLLTNANPLAAPITPLGYVKIDETLRGTTAAPILPVSMPDETYDYWTIIDSCDSSAAATSSSAFAASAWGVDFSGQTRHTWHIAPPNTATGAETSYTTIGNSTATYVIPNTVPAAAPSTASSFEVKSIVGNCIIPATTTFVAGFFACDILTIQGRTQPLMLVGTFIVGRSNIDAGAVNAGITFRSIYHPQVTADLRARGILTDNFGGACLTVPNFPVWWPELTPEEYTKFRSCNVVSLRDKANPFTWSSVDPDCGLVGIDVHCKHHPTNFLLTEISRESDLQ